MSDEREYGVYFVRGAGRVKIGQTGDLVNRLSTLRNGSPVDLELLGWMPCGTHKPAVDVLEAALHEKWAALRVKGEWFAETPDLLDYIAHHAAIGAEQARAGKYSRFTEAEKRAQTTAARSPRFRRVSAFRWIREPDFRPSGRVS